MKPGKIAGAMLIALALSSCIMHRQTQPEVEGCLIDRTGKPVPGAKITLEREQTLSDDKGRFGFQGQHEWIFFLPIGPMDWMYHTSLQMSANGKEYEAESGGGPGGPHELEGKAYNVICTLPDLPGKARCQSGL